MVTKMKIPAINDVWPFIRTLPDATKRGILLYGPPGTGKSYIAKTAGIASDRVHPVVLHQDIPAAELRGHFMPQKDGSFAWQDGPAIAAWRDGGRLVIDEIDKAGDDALSFLLAILDDPESAQLELGTTNEILRPHPSFHCWATMNAEPEDLPPALIDRFPIMIHVTGTNPEAIALLPQDLQNLAATLVTHPDPERRLSYRAIKEYGFLRDTLGSKEMAAFFVFGENAPQILYDLEHGAAADPK